MWGGGFLWGLGSRRVVRGEAEERMHRRASLCVDCIQSCCKRTALLFLFKVHPLLLCMSHPRCWLRAPSLCRVDAMHLDRRFEGTLILHRAKLNSDLKVPPESFNHFCVLFCGISCAFHIRKVFWTTKYVAFCVSTAYLGHALLKCITASSCNGNVEHSFAVDAKLLI